MIGDCNARPIRGWGSGGWLAGGVLLTTAAGAAAIGIGVAHTGGPAPEGPSATPVDLVASPSATGADAYTIGAYTFDPFIDTGCSTCVGYLVQPSGAETEGWSSVPPLAIAAPLLDIGGADAGGIVLSPQYIEVYNSSGTALGTILTSDVATQLFGDTDVSMTVLKSLPVTGETAADLPAVGTVYNILDFNLPIPEVPPFTNVYVATPGSPGTVTDFAVTTSGKDNLDAPLVLPAGTLDLQGLLGVNGANAPAPGDAFTGLQAGDSTIGADAFSMGGFTFNPETSSSTEGYNAAGWLVGIPPLLNIAGADLNGIPVISQTFDIYSGTTEVGSIGTAEEVVTILGMTDTVLTVTSATPATGKTAADLPVVGTVYSVLGLSNLGTGDEADVYVATPGSSGTVTQTLVTTSGDIAQHNDFNAANALSAGTALAGLSANEPDDSAIGPLAFTIGGITFNPETAVGTIAFNAIPALFGAPGGLLNLSAGGGTVVGSTGGGPLDLDQQIFYIYDGSGSSATEVGRINTAVTVEHLFVFDNTEFTSLGCYGGTCTGTVPASGTVYDVLQLAPDVENVYSATPTGTVTDTLITPLGPLFDLSFVIPGIDAAAPIDPGDAIPGGLDVPF